MSCSESGACRPPRDSQPGAHVGTILLGTLLIGTIDILWAIVNSMIEGRGGLRVLQSVAGGFLGKATYDGGVGTMILGLATHFFIACCVMTVFYLASRKFPALARRPWIYGPLYGLLVYVVMYQVVLPLSAWHTQGITLGVPMAKAVFIHLFGVGLVAALVARKGSAPPSPGTPR